MPARFRGKLAFLSNFYLLDEPVYLEGDPLPYSTTEHAYQAAKSFDATYRRKVQAAATPGISKRLGKEVIKRPDWHEVNLDVMRHVLKQKFKPGSKLAEKLLATGNEELVEENTWNDCFWGQCPLGVGENHLGKMLMELRSELRGTSK